MRALGTTLVILVLAGAGSPTLACDQGTVRTQPGKAATTPTTGYTRERCWPSAVRPSPALGAPALGAPGKAAGKHRKARGRFPVGVGF
ncbi:hypothetical protein [uncultured Methylobacterium sp.]|uniref:hypothetical protein n=1 Tax=uncultured Methylobacterium sp. TaxID=157278 RepID=UPI0035CA5344